MEEDDAIENPLIHPCKCSGTMKYIHLGCLKQWIGTQSCVKVDSNEDCCIYLIHKIQCELCKENLPDSIQHNKKIFDIVDFGKDYSNYMTIEALTLDKYKNKYLYVVNLDNDKDIKIGRGHDTNLLLSDISVSRLHCKISKSKNNFFIEDFDSKFGTLILMQNPIFQLNTEIPLNIQIGRTFIRLKVKKPFKFFNCCDDTEKIDDNVYHEQNSKFIEKIDIKKDIKNEDENDNDDDEEDIDYSEKKPEAKLKIVEISHNENDINDDDNNDLNNGNNVNIFGKKKNNNNNINVDYNQLDTANNVITNGNANNENNNNNNNHNNKINNNIINEPTNIITQNNNNNNNNNNNQQNTNNIITYHAQPTRLINV